MVLRTVFTHFPFPNTLPCRHLVRRQHRRLLLRLFLPVYMTQIASRVDHITYTLLQLLSHTVGIFKCCFFLSKQVRTLVAGNPLSIFRSQSTLPGTPVSPAVGEPVSISITNTPPVDGTRATSPRSVEKVESSSWANCCTVSRSKQAALQTHIGSTQHPLALSAEANYHSGVHWARHDGRMRSLGSAGHC